MSVEARKPVKVYVMRKAIGDHGPAFVPPDVIVIDQNEKNVESAAREFLCKCRRVDRDRASELFDFELLC